MSSPISPDHIFEFAAPSEPAISADGSRVAFTRTDICRQTMTRSSLVVTSSAPFDDFTEATGGPSDAAPAFVGDQLAFLRPDEQGRKQLWLQPIGGGGGRRITSLPGGVDEFVFSPNGERAAVISSVDDSADAAGQTENPRPRVVRRIRYRHDHRGFTGDAFRHLYVVDVESGSAQRISRGAGDHWAPVWSPDGGAIVCVSDDIEARDTTTHTQAKVFSLPDGAAATWSEGLPYVWALAWSPDGSALASIGCHDPAMWDPRSAWLYALDSGGVRRLTDGLETPVPECGLSWTRERGIAFVAARRGQYAVCAVSPAGGGVRQLTQGGVLYAGAAFDAAASRAALVVEAPGAPAEAAIFNLDSREYRTLTTYAAPYLADHPPGRMEKMDIRRGGFEIESRVIFPPDFNPARRYPLALDIHGGPNGRFSDSFDPTQHVLATNGYVVLAVNPRGSSSYGPEFTKSVLGDWGGEDFLDILAAVDEVSARPYIDEARMGLHGFSYGGFMSSWIIGHDHRFKAAVVGAMCANLHSMYGASDIGVSFGELNWGGDYVEARDKFLERSPITYAPNVRTPALLLHGEDDLRCPIEQSEQYFVALKRMGKTVEFVRYPQSTHRFRKLGHPALIVDYYERLLAWFERYVGAGAR